MLPRNKWASYQRWWYRNRGRRLAQSGRPAAARSRSSLRPELGCGPNLSARKTNLDRNFHNFGQALFWIFNRPTCRVAPLCRGELNGSKFWSAAKYLRRRSRIDVAAAGADLDHDRPDRRGDALASLVKDTRPTARRAAERCPRAARSPKDPSNTLNAVSDALIAVSVQITDLIRYSETVKQQARPLGDGAAFAGVPSPEAVANPFPTSTVAP
jgi:hypothetical protein